MVAPDGSRCRSNGQVRQKRASHFIFAYIANELCDAPGAREIRGSRLLPQTNCAPPDRRKYAVYIFFDGLEHQGPKFTHSISFVLVVEFLLRIVFSRDSQNTRRMLTSSDSSRARAYKRRNFLLSLVDCLSCKKPILVSVSSKCRKNLSTCFADADSARRGIFSCLQQAQLIAYQLYRSRQIKRRIRWAGRNAAQ